MRKQLTWLLAWLAIAAAFGGGALAFRAPHRKGFDTPYQAILLDNGAAYYAKILKIDDDYVLLSDVYYVQPQVDTVTKQTRNVLVRRGTEWHAPDQSLLSSRHIVMIEPVTEKSKLAEAISALAAKGKP
jgi:hypothetical protein